MTQQTVRDLVEMRPDSSLVNDGPKANTVWIDANRNLDTPVVEFAKTLPVSESYVRKVLKGAHKDMIIRE